MAGRGVLKPVNNSNSVQTVQNLFVSGNVGIGTSGPSTALHVVNNTRGILRLEETSLGQQYDAVQFYGPNSSSEIGFRTDNSLMYFSMPANAGENNAKMVINPTGYVGIGLTTQ